MVFHYILKFIPHINIALAFTLLTLFVTDRFNRAMSFINNDITKWMLCIFCVGVVIEAVSLLWIRRMEARECAEEEDAKKKRQ